ncbi:MAG: hypothetical protein HY822_23645 [Acidobacteria bacterium]|nr:hypothetical protein [Acidobacteriota bacterium]
MHVFHWLWSLGLGYPPRTLRLAVLVVAAGLCAQEPAASPARSLSLNEVLARMAAMDHVRAGCLSEYSGTRLYVLDNKRFGTHAEMQVRMTFQPPAAKTFEVVSAKGSKVIRSRVLQRLIQTEQEAARADVRPRTLITPANYTFKLAGTDTEQGRMRYILEAEPIKPSKYLFRGRVWVDAEDFAVARIEGAPAQNPSFWIHRTAFVHTYRKFGDFWLSVSNYSRSDVRVFGQTHVNLDYTDYRFPETHAARSACAGLPAQGGSGQ